MADNLYIPVHTIQGQLHTFDKNSAILNAWEGPDPFNPMVLIPVTIPADSVTDEDWGFSAVRWVHPDVWVDDPDALDYFPDDAVPRERFQPNGTSYDPKQFLDYSAAFANSFPAHVFTPTGRILADGASPERFTLLVGSEPQAALSRRFIDPDAPTDANKLAPVEVQLYKSTGRVRIASEGM